jgi:hypothetical protein
MLYVVIVYYLFVNLISIGEANWRLSLDEGRCPQASDVQGARSHVMPQFFLQKFSLRIKSEAKAGMSCN